jgi:Fic family protein
VYVRLLQIRDMDDVSRFLSGVAACERLRGRLEHLGPDADSESRVLSESTTSAVRMSGFELEGGHVRTLLDQRPPLPSPGIEAAVIGYADLIRLVMAQGADIPFTESQIKYFHSQLLRWEPTADRRRYRAEAPAGIWGFGGGPSPAAVQSEMPRLVTWTQEQLAGDGLHPLLAIPVFLYRFLVLRPFAAANRRLAMVLAVFLLDKSGFRFVRRSSFEAAMERRRDEMLEAFRQVRASVDTREDVSPWIDVWFKVVLDCAERVEAVPPRAVRRAVATPPPGRLTPRQLRILEVVQRMGGAKIGELLGELGLARATVKKDLRGLVDAGQLLAYGQRKGTIYYPAANDSTRSGG